MRQIDSEVSISVEDFLAQNAPDIQGPSDITAKQAAAKWGCGEKLATTKLDQLVADGKMTRHKGVILNVGKSGIVWRIIPQNWVEGESRPGSKNYNKKAPN